MQVVSTNTPIPLTPGPHYINAFLKVNPAGPRADPEEPGPSHSLGTGDGGVSSH